MVLTIPGSAIVERYTFRSWGEQMKEADGPEQSAAHFWPIVGVFLFTQSGADYNEGYGNGNGNGNDDGVGDGNQCIKST